MHLYQIGGKLEEKTLQRQKLFKRHFLYENGKEKFNRELDVSNFINAIRKVKLMSKIIFSKEQNLMIDYQKYNIIHTTTSCNTDELDIKSMANNKRPGVKLMALGHIKDLVNKFSGDY
eukprot:CAMPEP_0176368802 /NCGR_PEP_ID=MMETSP0126-20121128/22853_1 /TAXON_ID=141414 ORGANISM="Strombidinopsis acuminatum, Strain SPMC142" /NCGR_SAMPLE_ID=MMETSP0126 /ASSEMBLY_ACC=CAM_ASM_000229 /LENGTH=117 /DNA_ID=CAMNT_0017727205 /DNA_START=282 /DNA_END=636 /DNA_ORIENTATION=-